MAGSFQEVLFPTDISYGSSGGPKFKTTVFTADSGYEQRNIDWQMVRCEYDCSQAIKTQEQMSALLSFFMAVQGRAYGFRFLDWGDYQINNQTLGVGNGTTKSFQLIKTYTSAQAESGEAHSFTRPITKINWGSIEDVTVGGATLVEGSDFTVDYTTGLFTFHTAPAGPVYQTDGNGNQVLVNGQPVIITPAQTIKVGYCEFHVPVRFDTDQIDITQEFWETSSWPNIKMVEVRDWSNVIIPQAASS